MAYQYGVSTRELATSVQAGRSASTLYHASWASHLGGRPNVR